VPCGKQPIRERIITAADHRAARLRGQPRATRRAGWHRSYLHYADGTRAGNRRTAFTAVVARGPQIIVDLAGLEFIDSSGVAALVRGRNLARQAGGELLLAAPRQQVLRMLTLTRLVDVFPIHATVAEAASHYRRVPVLPRRRSLASWPRAAMRSRARALVRERRQLRKRA